MYSKFLILVVFFIFSSCSNKKLESSNTLEAIKFYNIASDKEENLDVRLKSINRAYRLLGCGKSDSISNKILYKKITIHYSNKEYDSMIYHNKILLKQAQFNNDIYHQGKANYLFGFYFDDIKFHPDSAFYYYNKSKSNFLKLKDSSEVGKRLLNMAYLQKNSSDYFGSKETIIEALKYLLPKKDNKYIASSYNLLAISNKELLNFEDAIDYYKIAIEKTQSKKDILAYKNNLATLIVEKKSYKKAIEIFKTILEDTILKNYPKQYVRVKGNLAFTKWKHSATDVRDVLLNVLSVRKRLNDKLGLIDSYKNLGEFYLNIDKSKSLEYFNNALKTSKLVKNPKGELEVLYFLIAMDKKNIKIRDRYIFLSDSLKNQELKVKTQFAKLQYDDEVKTKELYKLNNLAKQQQLEVSIQKRQKIIYLLLGALSIILTLFYLYYLIQKHKREKANEVYRREKHISKRIHDEIANDVSVLANYVANNSNETQTFSKKVLEDKLESIYSRARDISVDIASINLIEFTKELKNLILQYNTKDVKVITNVDDFEWQTISDFKKIAIYRVVQELLINTKKHSNCKRVTLMLNDKKQNRILTYTDNGDGFDRNSVKINGLANAESRIKNIGGTFSFDTSPKNGFKAMLSIRR